MPKVCTKEQGTINKPSFSSNGGEPKSPHILSRKLVVLETFCITRSSLVRVNQPWIILGSAVEQVLQEQKPASCGIQDHNIPSPMNFMTIGNPRTIKVTGKINIIKGPTSFIGASIASFSARWKRSLRR